MTFRRTAGRIAAIEVTIAAGGFALGCAIGTAITLTERVVRRARHLPPFGG